MKGITKQITIQQNFPTPGYSGVDSWQNWPDQPYAVIQQGFGREYFAAKQRHSDLDVLAELNQYMFGLNETMRIIIDGIAHEIISIIGIRELNKMELKLRKVI